MKLRFGNLVAALCAAIIVLGAAEKADAVTTVADLAIFYVGASSGTVEVGQPITLTLALTNQGPGAVYGTLMVTNHLPPGFVYLSSAGDGSFNPTNGTWMVVPGAAGSINYIMITVQPTNGGNYIDTAIATNIPSGVTDPNWSNNIASFSFSVYPPITINPPTNLTVSATGQSGAAVSFVVSATGGCGGSLSIVSIPASGSTFATGSTTVSNTASDTCGNSSSCNFIVTVISSNSLINFTRVARVEGGIQLSWPTNYVLVLEQNDSLVATDWVTVTNAPAVNNGQYQVRVASTNSHAFFRLHTP